MQNYNLKFKTLVSITLSAICYFLFSSSIFAAELKFKTMADPVKIGNVFDVILVLNTEGETINALETTLKYSDNLKLKNISDGNSIINLWISRPKIENNKNSIFLSGLIPGGIKTEEGIVLNLTFETLYGNRGDVRIEDVKILLNDSDASEAKVTISNLNFEVQDNLNTAPQSQKLILDFLPPDEFKIYLSKDTNIFNNLLFISFNAQDKGSGINHYEIREKFFGISGNWGVDSSPHLLSDQFLLSIIEVRAVDNVGRERISIFVPIRLYVFYVALASFLTSIFLFKIFKHLKINYKKGGI